MAKYDKPLDHDEEEGGSARYRLPFALCKERGIHLPDWATPRDAWNALDRYGINPSAEYEKLRKKQKKDYNSKYRKEKEREKKDRKNQANDPEHSPDYNYNPKPGCIAGVKKGEAMTFEEANRGRCNPYYKQSIEFGGEYYGYTTNCQTCVVAFEARMRGYDVRALPNNRNPYINDLSHQTNLAYRDMKGNIPAFINKKPREHSLSFVEKNVQNGRYTLQFLEGPNKKFGHIISAFRQNGKLTLYDPQSGEVIKNTKQYLKGKCNLKLLRVDNLALNGEYTNYVLKGAKK